MPLKLQKQTYLLITFGIILTPLMTLEEVFSLYAGTITSQTNVLSSIYIKGIKDVLLVILLGIGSTAYIIFREKMSLTIIIYFLLTFNLVLFSAAFSIQNSYLLTASGLRWAIPLLLPFFLYPLINSEVIYKISRALLIVFVLHFILQLLQLFFLKGWYGSTFFGLSARNPGIFLIPNTAAFFTITVFFVNVYLIETSKKLRRLLIITTFISVVLTASGTGFVVWILLYIIFYLNKGFYLLVPIVFLSTVPIIFYVMNFVFSRGEEYVTKSGGTRIGLFLEELNNAALISSQFGYGTNTAVLLGEGKILDSTLASVTSNLGLIALIIFLSIVFLLGTYSIIIKSKNLLGFIIVLILFSASTIITEAYPMNLILATLVAYSLKTGELLKIKKVYFYKGV